MRWERLFADLEAGAEAIDAQELESEVAELTRHERSRLRLVDRLRGSVGRSVDVRVSGVGRIVGTVRAVGADWLLIRPSNVADHLVRLPAVLEISGLAPFSALPGSEGEVAARLGLPAVLRGVARDRTPVAVTTVDGSTVAGTLEVVGADFVELSERRHDEPGLVGAQLGRRTLAMAAIAEVREQ